MHIPRLFRADGRKQFYAFARIHQQRRRARRIKHAQRMVFEREHGVGAGKNPLMAKMDAIEKTDGKRHARILFLGIMRETKSTGCISMSFINGIAASTQ